MEYTTQMYAAKRGIVTEKMKIVAKDEDMDIELLMKRMAKGEMGR